MPCIIHPHILVIFAMFTTSYLYIIIVDDSIMKKDKFIKDLSQL